MQETKYFDNIFQLNRNTTQEKYDNMEKEINDFLTYVKSKQLSPIEEVMLVYDKVKLLEYADNDDSLETRQLPDIITNGKAVCVGYTNLFNEYLSRLGYQTCAIESYIGNVSHMHSLVAIKDEKYGINGLYNFDPTFDSLDKDSQDRTSSYAFFGRSIEEINHLKEERNPIGVSIAIMKGIDSNTSREIMEDSPSRTMNIINGFHPTEENKNFISNNYDKLKDKSNWPILNDNFQFELAQIGFKARRAENIPCDVMEQVIKNVRRIQNPQMTEEQLSSDIDRVKEFNNSQFRRYYNDSRLLFNIKPENYVSPNQYQELLEKIQEIYSSVSPDEKLKTTIEFTNGQEQQALYRLMSLTDEEKKVLIDCTFDSNYDFIKKFMNPTIYDYANNFSYSSSQIFKPEYFNLNIRSYEALSTDGSSLTIIDGNLDYLQQIDSHLRTSSKEKKSEEIPRTNSKQQESQTQESFFAPPTIDTNVDMNEPLLSSTSNQSELNAKNDLIDDTISLSDDERIIDYNNYRAQMLAIMSNPDSSSFIHSDFTIVGDKEQICRHTIEKMSDESKQIISKREFKCDELFRTCMLEPALIDYAKTNPITNGNINLSENGMAQYMAYSETNNVLTINNINKQYADYIDTEIKKVDPVLFQQQMELFKQQTQETYGYQRILTKNSGFLNILLLSSIVGFFAGFVFIATYVILKFKGLG